MTMTTDQAPQPVVTLGSVSFAFGTGPPVLSHLDLRVMPGEFIALVGASGSGKSTLLRLVSGLLTPTAGTVRRHGTVGMMFQQPRLLGWRSTLANVHLPAELQGEDREIQARSLLRLVGIDRLADCRADTLSGGEQQRAALARALLLGPQLLLLDEPFAALDALTREELHLELLRAWQETGAACILVTHDIAEALFLADRVLVMGEGGIQAEFASPLRRPRLPEHRYSPALAERARAVRIALTAARAGAPI